MIRETYRDQTIENTLLTDVYREIYCDERGLTRRVVRLLSDPSAGRAHTDESPTGPPIEPRELTEPRELRAMTHPVRLALLEVLSLNGELTATEAGELIGESPTTCSFHLRQLAKYGFVEEGGDAPGRRRPWRLVSHGVSFSSTDGDLEMGVASDALEGLLIQRWLDRLNRWRQERLTFTPEWQRAGFGAEYLVHLTSSELEQFSRDVMELLDVYRARSAEVSVRPADALPVEVVLFGYPISGAAPDGGSEAGQS
jgi:DNA-binding transcriptional ArsR family regulator